MTLQGPQAGAHDWPFIAGRSPRIVGGEGAWLICDDGRRILDAAGGAIVANVGHGRGEVVEAMARAAAGALDGCRAACIKSISPAAVPKPWSRR
jgi:4-aminobutyrate aminotransferase-like enzyme